MKHGLREDTHTHTLTAIVVDCHQQVGKLEAIYQKALPNAELVAMVMSSLKEKYGYGKSSLLATSLCCDEVNRDLEKTFIGELGDNFFMGGLAGFAFGGVTSFGAMAHHIPHGGSCLIVYGPHVGIDEDGNVGRINRRGRTKSGPCCGSAVAAAGYVLGVRNGTNKPQCMPTTPNDAQQYFVGNMLMPHADRLAKADDMHAELPMALYEVQDDLMSKIVEAGCQEVGEGGKIALLGGIQINTPKGASDYFLPLKFEVRDNQGKLLEDLLWD